MMSRELEEAIELHTRLDRKQGLESPNSSWPPELIIYYNNKKEKENENSCGYR